MPSISNKALEAQQIPLETADPKPEWVYVNIPQRDILDCPFYGIGINLQHFGVTDARHTCSCADSPKCNKTGNHKVSPEIAAEIRRRLKVAQAQDVKLFSAKVNLQALAQVAGSNPAYGASTNEFLQEQR